MFYERDASSESYGPRVHFNHITKTLNTLLQFIYFYFTLQFIYLQLSDLILAINEYKGIDNPLARVGCKYLLGRSQHLRNVVWVPLLGRSQHLRNVVHWPLDLQGFALFFTLNREHSADHLACSCNV